MDSMEGSMLGRRSIRSILIRRFWRIWNDSKGEIDIGLIVSLLAGVIDLLLLC